jgi:hypothetical protein
MEPCESYLARRSPKVARATLFFLAHVHNVANTGHLLQERLLVEF